MKIILIIPKILFCIWLLIFSKKYCTRKLAKFVFGFLELKDTKKELCLMQSSVKLSKKCECGKYKQL